MNRPKVYIDGKEGTTGLQIYERLGSRDDIQLLLIDEDKRKDLEERRKFLNEADLVFLCLPDAAAKEAVTLIDNPKTRVIDASTAHRTAQGWVYGFAELLPGQRQRRGPKNTYPARRFRSKRIHTSKIHPHRCSHSGKRASELPQRQPEKNAFMVLPYFLRHLYLQNSFTSLQAHHFPHDAVRAFYQSHKDQHVEDHFRHIGPNHRNR